MQSSEYIVTETMPDGRAYVLERFVTATGRTLQQGYTSEVGWGATEFQAHLDKIATELDSALAELEAIAVMGQE